MAYSGLWRLRLQERQASGGTAATPRLAQMGGRVRLARHMAPISLHTRQAVRDEYEKRRGMA
jgi:hypothetical protein